MSSTPERRAAVVPQAPHDSADADADGRYAAVELFRKLERQVQRHSEFHNRQFLADGEGTFEAEMIDLQLYLLERKLRDSREPLERQR